MAEKNVELKLKSVRLSFCDVFEPAKNENDDGSISWSYKTNILLDKVKDADQIKAIREAMKQAKLGTFGDKAPPMKSELLCLKDGEPIDPDTVDESVPGSGVRKALYDGYAGQMYLSASRKVKSKDAPNPVQILGPRKTAKDAQGNPIFPTLTEADGLIYAGCEADVIVRIYGYDAAGKNHPSRINASLEAIKFVKHGDPFGAKRVDAQSQFDEESDDEDDGLGDAPAKPKADEFDDGIG